MNMYVCFYVFMCVFMNVCTYKICIYECMYICTYVYICVNLYIFVYVRVFLYICMCVCKLPNSSIFPFSFIYSKKLNSLTSSDMDATRKKILHWTYSDKYQLLTGTGFF